RARAHDPARARARLAPRLRRVLARRPLVGVGGDTPPRGPLRRRGRQPARAPRARRTPTALGAPLHPRRPPPRRGHPNAPRPSLGPPPPRRRAAQRRPRQPRARRRMNASMSALTRNQNETKRTPQWRGSAVGRLSSLRSQKPQTLAPAESTGK